MTMMKDSFNTEYYLTDFNLKYDVEKPAILKATVIIPESEITDTYNLSTACGTSMYQAYNMCKFGNDLYVAMGSGGSNVAGQIMRYKDEQFWDVAYDGEGLREVPQCMIMSYSGSAIYVGCRDSAKILYSTSGTSFSQIGSLSGGSKISCIVPYTYGGTNYILAVVGKKLWRATEGSSTWTDVTPSNIHNNDITYAAFFNSKLWISTSSGPYVYYSSDNGATFTSLFLETTFLYGTPTFLYTYGSNLYVFGENSRISRINTSNVVTNVYNSLTWGTTGCDGICATTFESKPIVALKNGRIIYSTDGTGDYGTWAEFFNFAGSGCGNPLCMGVYTDLYVGSDKNQVVKCTAGGHSWSQAVSTTNQYINCCIVAATSYWGCGEDEVNTGGIFRSSTPTGTWYQYYGVPEYYILDVCVYGSYIYACTGGKGFILRSIDGTNWDVVYDSSSTNLYALGLSSDGYLYAGGDSSGYCFRTNNGTTWSTVSGLSTTIYCMTKDVGIYLHVGCTDGTIRYYNSGWYTAVSGIGAAVRSITTPMSYYSTASIVAGTANGRFYYYTGTWTYNTVGSSSRTIWGIVYYNSKWYVALDNGQIYHSTNASPTFSWVNEFNITDSAAKCLGSDGFYLYIGGYSTDSKANIFKYSPSKLMRETTPDIQDFEWIESFCVYNNYLYAAGGLAGEGSVTYAAIFRSTDGIRWEKVWSNESYDSSCRALCVFGSYLYMAESGSGNAKIYRSYSGNEWSLVATLSETRMYQMTVFSGYLYGATQGTYGKVYRTSDGITWTSVYSTGSSAKPICYTVHYASAESKIFAGGGNTSGSNRFLVYSSNGTSWSDGSSGLTATLYCVHDINSFNGYVFAGVRGLTNYPLWRSTTGTSSWTNVTDVISISALSLIYVNGIWADSDKMYVVSNYSKVYSSTDGTTFTLITDASQSLSFFPVIEFFDNVVIGGYRVFIVPISRMGRLFQMLRNSDYFEFYSCENNLTEKFILKEVEIQDETLMDMTFQSQDVDLWRSYGYYIEGTNGYVDYSEDGIYADVLANKVVDSTCNQKFRIKYCPHVLIKIKGEWLSKTQWLYEIARNLSFAINDNSSYLSCELKATEDSSDVIIDHMNVVIEDNGDIFIMPSGSTIYGTNPNYEGYFTKRITDITNYVWEATKVRCNMIDYDNAIVLDGSGTGANRKNYLAKPISVSYNNTFSNLDKVRELSNIICEPNYSGAVSYGVASTGAALNLWAQMANTNYHIPVYVSVYHPSLIVSRNDTVVFKASVSNTAVLDGATDTTYWKEVGFSFGGGNEAGKFNKMLRVVLREERASSTYSYYIKIFRGATELASTTLTTEISSVSDANYLVVKWYLYYGVPMVEVWVSNSTMPDPDVDTPKLQLLSESLLTEDFGIIGLHSSAGFTITSSTAYYGKTVPKIWSYFGSFSVDGQSLSLWTDTAITKPVMLVRDKSITSKDEARNVALSAYQNASTTKELLIRVDPEQYMWGSTANRIYIGQWVSISGKGYYDGQYRVKTIEVRPTGMWLGLDNTKITFTDYVDGIRQQVNKNDSFG
jgi:hypothetical protein